VVALLVWWARAQWEERDQTGNYVVLQFGREVLAPMPMNALFLTMTDLVTNAVRYIQARPAPREKRHPVGRSLRPFPGGGLSARFVRRD